MKLIVATITALVFIGLIGVELGSAQAKRHSEIIQPDTPDVDSIEKFNTSTTDKPATRARRHSDIIDEDSNRVVDQDSSAAPTSPGSSGYKRHSEILESNRNAQ